MILETIRSRNSNGRGNYCILKCDNCGETFERGFVLSNRHKNHFCIRKCLDVYSRENHWSKGKPRKQETKDKIREALTGRKRPEFWGKNNPSYKNGKTKNSRGYIIVSHQGKRIPEHRMIVEKIVGRELDRMEEVHHMDENKSNNDINNLYLFTKKDHRIYHLVKRVLDKFGTLDNFVKCTNLISCR